VSTALAFELAAVAATSVGLVFALRERGWARRARMVACDLVMIVAMLDAALPRQGVLSPIVWVGALVGLTLANTFVASSTDGTRHSGLRVSIAMLVMAGLLAHPSATAAPSGHLAHAGGVGALGAAVSVAAVAYVIGAGLATAYRWRGVGSGHAVATIGAVALMALGCAV
jgi:hypothetical protein